MTEYEELLMLREMVSKQNKKLEEQEKIITSQEQTITSKDQTINSQEQTIISQKQLLYRQEVIIENMTQALLHARKKMFGASTETSSQIEGQLSFFETTDELVKELFSEQKKNSNQTIHTRSKETRSTCRNAGRTPKRSR